MGKVYGISDEKGTQEISLEMLDWPYYNDRTSSFIKLPDFICNKLMAMMEIKNFDFFTSLFFELDKKNLLDFCYEWQFSLLGTNEFYFLPNCDQRDQDDPQKPFESWSVKDWKQLILKNIQKEKDRLLFTAIEQSQKAMDDLSYNQKIFKKINLALSKENPI